MGWFDRISEDDFNCTAAKRLKSSVCSSTICYNGECNEQKTASGLQYATCNCDWGWQGPRCTRCCSLDCQNDGVCTIMRGFRFCDCLDSRSYHVGQFCGQRKPVHTVGVKVLFCRSADHRYFGVHCERLRPTTTFDVSSLNLTYPPNEIRYNPFWNKYTIPAVSSMAVVAVILIVLLVIVPYILYKKRNIFILKMIYRFKKFEDDDSRSFDVFLSYRTRNDKDRRFVIYELLPGIEHMGFTTCIDQRDFLVGAAIAETIKVAIQESRRSIIVVSPAYIEGEWPEFEVQCAMTESLRKAHRIIPIIFEPIDDYRENLSPTLAHILESITYIEWPQNSEDSSAKAEFWRRLKLSLPKKKDRGKRPTEGPAENGKYPILLRSRFEFADGEC